MADVYRWHLAPDGLATRRQLRALGLRPGGQDVVAELHRPRRRKPPLVAYLYRVDHAKPVRPMTPARAAALAAARAGPPHLPQLPHRHGLLHSPVARHVRPLPRHPAALEGHHLMNAAGYRAAEPAQH